ncbi:uncharacterized protein DSM5745_08868 [Aspergillus mulundensis]|uniref:ubiquitinyl hydrolase 1 n=1 Tax=Aspergillus mulundensis TaxID=1810919 RepID=A0A3D8R560_9EURO|nr:Uncharacterized protein DSM5745_08868 [Aspergillus mulundensis]RDW69108.1 Uncharacterized protein DSM5745_08868 [Aspergillus mulundensis]
MSSSISSDLPFEAITYLFHHVFLPPKLPQDDDYNADHDLALLSTVIRALRSFTDHVPSQNAKWIAAMFTMLHRLKQTLVLHGGISESKLKTTLEQLLSDGGALPVYVRSQNAALLINKNDTGVHLEAFELSPQNAAVNSTVGRLQRQFPGSVYTIDTATFRKDALADVIAPILAKMSSQSVAGTKPQVKKARRSHDEDRDATDPKMVTEFFTTFLRPWCKTIGHGLQLHKNTREEVLWLDSRSPWRRSSLWLLIRVALQLMLRRACSVSKISEDLYKHFMVYYMSTILDTCREKVSAEQCYIMNCKIARRLQKLDLSMHPAWFTYVQQTLQAANNSVQKSWKMVMLHNSFRHNAPLASLDFNKDVYCSLPFLDGWIEGITRRRHSLPPGMFQPQPELIDFQSIVLPVLLATSDPKYQLLRLAAFEAWVEVNLDIWLQSHLNEENTSLVLGDLITHYYQISFGLYSQNPEAVSVMVLTILELWIACDKATIQQHPLLREYSTCIPMGVFEALVLPYRSQMIRLSRAEDYLYQRQRRLRFPHASIFQDFGTRTCFSVQYFAQSPEHQGLLATIETNALETRAAKKMELRQKHEEYKQLNARANQMSCTYIEVPSNGHEGSRKTLHSTSCQRCSYKSQASSLSINIHEWPLPSQDLQAKSTVFELNVPRPFSVWRDTTLFFLLTVLHLDYGEKAQPRTRFQPQTYEGLRPFFTSASDRQRAGLLSQNKPHQNTHRRERMIIDVTESDICLENGMSFRYYDSFTECFITNFKATDELATSCMYKLPESSSSLQQFLFRPTGQKNGPSPNTVIASQDACPQNMSLEEYKALCSMALGVEIQWQNILRQLAMPSVVFRKAETCLFILQIIRQVGPRAQTVLRAGHAILHDGCFVKALLAAIEDTADRIKENWETAHELSALIFLVQRVLSLSTSADAVVEDRCLELLSSLRQISFNWVKHVRDKAGKEAIDVRRIELITRSTHLALICVATYDSESPALRRILANASDASIWFQCCMIIHDRKGIIDVINGGMVQILYQRWQVVAYRCQKILAHNVVHNRQPALDLAIREAWAAYQMGSSWILAPVVGDHWLVASHGSFLAHYNLLTGELLINGRPLARLPSEFESHKTYKILFGESPVEVMPSEIPGMLFSGQRKHMNQTIHFGKELLHKSDQFELSVRAVSEESEVREFVPVSLLQGAFPDAFLEDCVHWYNFNTGHVEFRPLKNPWVSSSSHWRLQRGHPGSNAWYLVKGDMSLISMCSPTAKLLSCILQPIERASRLHCKLNTSSSTLEIELPRLRLSFNLKSGQSCIRSRQYRGMLVDSDQSLGTLVGLRTKLLLRHEKDGNRMVLIPDGNATWLVDGDHITVQILWQEVSYTHVYSVDEQLGRLADNGSLQSKLMLCYLHGITSFCLPDPLTGKTGTEQALTILRSASTRSFGQLRPENVAILVKLAGLTPERKYYPANERVMQSIKWRESLSCLAQHRDFLKQVLFILDQNRRMRIFYPDAKDYGELPLPSVDNVLSQRDKIRSSSFRSPGFGAEDHTCACDTRYTERGQDHQSQQCYQVFTLCQALYNKTTPFDKRLYRDDWLSEIWKFLGHVVEGPSVLVEKTRIAYDATWLFDGKEFLSKHWCSIHQLLCSGASRPSKQQMMIWLSTLSLSDQVPMGVLKSIAALYILPSMASIMPPSRILYNPSQGYELDDEALKTQIRFTMRTGHNLPVPLDRNPGESEKKFKTRKTNWINTKREEVLEKFVAGLRIQWPTASPVAPISNESPGFGDYFDAHQAMPRVQANFSIWFHNLELKEYLERVYAIISREMVQPVEMPPVPLPPLARPTPRTCGFASIGDVLDGSLGPPPFLATEPPHLGPMLQSDTSATKPVSRLPALVDVLGRQAQSEYERHYVEQLYGSSQSLLDIKQADKVTLNRDEVQKITSEHLRLCVKHSKEIRDSILARLTLSGQPTETANQKQFIQYDILKTVASINMGPRLSPDLLLQQLNRRRWSQLPMDWKTCFIAYGRSITALQRAKRLVKLTNHQEQFVRELQNPGHTNWSPFEFPESLLLEIESGLLIREVQEQIAQEMRNAEQNAVMQLNMGEGKSSVIVPMVAAALANGSCLVRVLVAKPQSQQMLQMLVSKLGGLLGRQVYQLPVSRSLKIGDAEAAEIERMCLECMASGGVLLVQPEHILSLKLMCVECFTIGKVSVGQTLLRILELFRNSSRDVVDESDENFSVKFELIYTMGAQQALEFSPQRWTIIQQLLDLVRMYAPLIKAKLPHSVELDKQWPGGFPRTRLLREDAVSELFKMIANHICNKGIDSLPMSRQPELIRKAVFIYILNPDLAASEIAAVEDNSTELFWTSTNKDTLLLLRGLLAGGVLSSCLGQKRWRVNYGPHDSRRPPTKLSVPYRAKDNPAPRSEFSHPDVVVVLTCLSYYYAGLKDDELFLAFHHLINSDQADIEYQLWIDNAPELDQAYCQLGGINLQDRPHCLQHIFPKLRGSKGAIDYFLSHIVFPKEMKQFPRKLSASGWDIGEVKALPTAGFSGTNDSRVILPLSVKQLDLQEQNHTNALVLEYLLRPENSVVHVPAREGGNSDAQALLDMVVGLDPPTQVILDVGAQILELTNFEVAVTWLKMMPDNDSGRTQAVVFVSDSDEICVVDRTGLVEPLQTSPYATQLEACLVFLDEAHTRGIDLKLPRNYRAAVTLGAGITKDKLVQACMRMRDLGKGQSVVFCMPAEIKTKILSLIGKPDNYTIEVSDVLRWAVSETWVEMQRNIPLWAVQGERFERQCILWRKARGGAIPENHAKLFLEPESQSLEQRYRPRADKNAAPFLVSASNKNNRNIQLILERIRQFANVNFNATQLQEEQERQLAPELEQQRQVQRPPGAKARDHSLHPDLRQFVATGQLNRRSQAFTSAFQSLAMTTAKKHLDISEFPRDLLVTRDFERTILPFNGTTTVFDDYQRPVQWVLISWAYSEEGEPAVWKMLIISPYEANELHSDIRKSTSVTMHIYAPRQNRSFSPLDNLSLYTTPAMILPKIPVLLRIQLNLFAGQLYISSYQEYREICDFLGVAYYTAPEGLTVLSDGFILEANDGRALPGEFQNSPLKFLKVLMSTIRKDGQEIDKTHLGKLLDGKLLFEADFDEGAGDGDATLVQEDAIDDAAPAPAATATDATDVIPVHEDAADDTVDNTVIKEEPTSGAGPVVADVSPVREEAADDTVDNTVVKEEPTNGAGPVIADANPRHQESIYDAVDATIVKQEPDRDGDITMANAEEPDDDIVFVKEITYGVGAVDRDIKPVKLEEPDDDDDVVFVREIRNVRRGATQPQPDAAVVKQEGETAGGGGAVKEEAIDEFDFVAMVKQEAGYESEDDL